MKRKFSGIVLLGNSFLETCAKLSHLCLPQNTVDETFLVFFGHSDSSLLFNSSWFRFYNWAGNIESFEIFSNFYAQMAKHKQYHTRTSLNRGLVITLRSETCTKRKFTGKTHITVRHDSKGGLKCLTLGQRGVKKTTLMASTYASWNEFHENRCNYNISWNFFNTWWKKITMMWFSPVVITTLWFF